MRMRTQQELSSLPGLIRGRPGQSGPRGRRESGQVALPVAESCQPAFPERLRNRTHRSSGPVEGVVSDHDPYTACEPYGELAAWDSGDAVVEVRRQLLVTGTGGKPRIAGVFWRKKAGLSRHPKESRAQASGWIGDWR